MDIFLDINPLDRIIAPIDTSVYSEQEKKLLGKDLIEINNKYGIASFGNGLFHTIHPLESQYLLEGWKLPIEHCYPFIISSFGTIYFQYKKKLGWLIPAFKEKEYVTLEVDLAFDFILANPKPLNNAMFKDIHDQVFPKLGMLEQDELYAFVPALALGGARNADSVEKVKMKEHLYFLSQL